MKSQEKLKKGRKNQKTVSKQCLREACMIMIKMWEQLIYVPRCNGLLKLNKIKCSWYTMIYFIASHEMQ
jgi:hypothetical protein